jgi:hypothetical protein
LNAGEISKFLSQLPGSGCIVSIPRFSDDTEKVLAQARSLGAVYGFARVYVQLHGLSAEGFRLLLEKLPVDVTHCTMFFMFENSFDSIVLVLKDDFGTFSLLAPVTRDTGERIATELTESKNSKVSLVSFPEEGPDNFDITAFQHLLHFGW